jgi:predicted RNase H-like HicB family nuclease
MTKYEIILYWSAEDEAFIAEVPELAGCAADGPTRQEALANAELVIAEWLETARELDRPIPEPKARLRSHRLQQRPDQSHEGGFHGCRLRTTSSTVSA